MRRGKELRDYRDSLRRKSIEERRHKLKTKANVKLKEKRQVRREVAEAKQAKRLNVKSTEIELKLKSLDEYVCSREEPIRVTHVIESLGMGGGQTMMMELILGLNKYYEGKIINTVVCPRPAAHKYDLKLFGSYGVNPECVRDRDLPRFLTKNNSNIVLQHRLAVSKCQRDLIPSGIKYILMNHTYHQLSRLPNFIRCDFYVSVCDYLGKQTRWSKHVHPSRKICILNGVENDYVSDIESAELEGSFKTGRCHRLVHSKFKTDSIQWMQQISKKHIPGLTYYLLGHSNEAKKLCKKNPACHYIGSVNKRHKKMGIIKALDCYFYETQQHEGASVAILESLACGVPVLCMDYGGNTELVKNGINGFVVKDRNGFLSKLRYLNEGNNLEELKKSTLQDFNERLHVRHTACKYMQIFESVLK